MRAARALICLAVVVAACAANPQSPRGSGDKLYEAVAGGKAPMLAVIDSRSHSADRKLALGVPSPDWKHVYTTAGMSLVDTDPATGDTVSTLQLNGAYHLPAATANGMPGGLSPDGRWLVVERFDGADAQMPTATHMLVIETSAMKVRHQVDLAGYFEFDAVDDNDINLFLIQHLNGREYYVRLYDLTSGSLTANIVVDKSDGNQAMAGLRLSGVATVGGHWLFSMYVREHEAPFIHALSLDGPFAFCLDLPGSGYLDDPNQMNWSLAMSKDGSRLFAVNPAAGTVALVDTGANGAPSVIRTARFQALPGRAVMASNSAMVRGGTLIAGGSSGVVWIDTEHLTLSDRSVEGWPIAGLGLSVDGNSLYAVSDAGRIGVISLASHEVTGMYDPSAGTPMALMRVAAA
jgi:hypothetical protein